MSFQLSIPWRVALQQSSPPLSQLLIMLQPTTPFVYTMTANGSLGPLPLSQLKGALQGGGGVEEIGIDRKSKTVNRKGHEGTQGKPLKPTPIWDEPG